MARPFRAGRYRLEMISARAKSGRLSSLIDNALRKRVWPRGTSSNMCAGDWLICMHVHGGRWPEGGCVRPSCSSIARPFVLVHTYQSNQKVHMLQLLCNTFIAIVTTLLQLHYYGIYVEYTTINCRTNSWVASYPP